MSETIAEENSRCVFMFLPSSTIMLATFLRYNTLRKRRQILITLIHDKQCRTYMKTKIEATYVFYLFYYFLS